MSNTPSPIREAYCRRLIRVSRDLEHVARIGRPYLHGSAELARLWDLSRRARQLAETFDPSPCQPPAVPPCIPPDSE